APTEVCVRNECPEPKWTSAYVATPSSISAIQTKNPDAVAATYSDLLYSIFEALSLIEAGRYAVNGRFAFAHKRQETSNVAYLGLRTDLQLCTSYLQPRSSFETRVDTILASFERIHRRLSLRSIPRKSLASVDRGWTGLVCMPSSLEDIDSIALWKYHTWERKHSSKLRFVHSSRCNFQEKVRHPNSFPMYQYGNTAHRSVSIRRRYASSIVPGVTSRKK
ncbi:hypothetical protein MMC31_003817, partial [Peltigera leucophlebia]|nr:hypothetical protein [Peltigera leucophlebia]